MSMWRNLAAAVLFESDPAGPHRVRRLSVPLSQRIYERGGTPPWASSQAQCHAFWVSKTNDGPYLNSPAEYAAKSPAIVDRLVEFWGEVVNPEASIFEIGTNAGANLAALQRAGYSNVGGIEVNPHAVDEMRRSFPSLSSRPVQVGPAEAILPALEPDSRDLVFSMAVLMHVHPKSHSVFSEMARVAARFVCTVEAETASATYVFPRNYRRVFAQFGLTEIRHLRLNERTHPDVGRDYYGYVMRLFEKPHPQAPTPLSADTAAS